MAYTLKSGEAKVFGSSTAFAEIQYTITNDVSKGEYTLTITGARAYCTHKWRFHQYLTVKIYNSNKSYTFKIDTGVSSTHSVLPANSYYPASGWQKVNHKAVFKYDKNGNTPNTNISINNQNSKIHWISDGHDEYISYNVTKNYNITKKIPKFDTSIAIKVNKVIIDNTKQVTLNLGIPKNVEYRILSKNKQVIQTWNTKLNPTINSTLIKNSKTSILIESRSTILKSKTETKSVNIDTRSPKVSNVKVNVVSVNSVIVTFNESNFKSTNLQCSLSLNNKWTTGTKLTISGNIVNNKTIGPIDLIIRRKDCNNIFVKESIIIDTRIPIFNKLKCNKINNNSFDLEIESKFNSTLTSSAINGNVTLNSNTPKIIYNCSQPSQTIKTYKFNLRRTENNLENTQNTLTIDNICIPFSKCTISTIDTKTINTSFTVDTTKISQNNWNLLDNIYGNLIFEILDIDDNVVATHTLNNICFYKNNKNIKSNIKFNLTSERLKSLTFYHSFNLKEDINFDIVRLKITFNRIIENINTQTLISTIYSNSVKIGGGVYININGEPVYTIPYIYTNGRWKPASIYVWDDKGFKLTNS